MIQIPFEGGGFPAPASLPVLERTRRSPALSVQAGRASTPVVVAGLFAATSLGLGAQEPAIRTGDRCANAARGDTTGTASGVVRHAETDRPLPGARVRLVTDSGEVPVAIDTTDAGGRFVFCGLPDSENLRFGVSFAGTTSRLGPVQRTDPVTRTELRLDLGAPVFVVFTVRERQSGRAVQGASVELAPLGAEAVTDSSGHAAVRSLPPGTYRVTVRHVALATTSDTIRVDPGLQAEVELRAPSRVVELEPLEVSVTNRNPHLVEEGFYDRMRSDRGGHFMTPDSVANRDFARKEHFLRFVPDIQFRLPDSGCYAPYVNGREAFRRRAGGGWRKTADWQNLRGWRILAVEAYRHGEAPPEYGNYRWESPECAVIVFWAAPPGTSPPARRGEG